MTGGSILWLSYAVLWGLTLLLSLAVVLLLRDFARRRLVSPAARTRPVVPVGAVWSGVTVPTANGATLHFPEPAVEQLILIGAKRCALCRQALLALGEMSAENGSSLRYLFVYPGTTEELQLHIGDTPPGVTVIHDAQNVTRRQLGIVAYPYAIGVDAAGRVLEARVAYERQELESLRTALTVRRPAA